MIWKVIVILAYSFFFLQVVHGVPCIAWIIFYKIFVISFFVFQNIKLFFQVIHLLLSFLFCGFDDFKTFFYSGIAYDAKVNVSFYSFVFGSDTSQAFNNFYPLKVALRKNRILFSSLFMKGKKPLFAQNLRVCSDTSIILETSFIVYILTSIILY